MDNLRLIAIIIVILFCRAANAQQNTDSVFGMGDKLGKKYINSISERSEKIGEQLDKQTERYLAKLEKAEMKLKRKLARLDSSAAKRIFDGAEKQYADLQNKVKSKSAALLQKQSAYMPGLDIALTSLTFISNNPMLANLKGGASQVQNALGKVKELQNQFRQAASVKDFIRQRKEYLKEQLRNYNLGSELKKYNQTAAYYGQQIDEYKAALSDPQKAERKVLELLNKLPAFQSFMKKNSMLASLFALPGNDIDPLGNAANLAGLQTRASVQSLIQNQLSAGGPNAMAMFQQNMQEAVSHEQPEK